jgi:hypothetical protein
MPLVLNGTTGVSGVDGSAGTPALQGTDSNTGIVFGTDTISLVEGGTAAFSVDSSANASLVGTLAMGSSFLRNRIINGAMSFWQRATTYTATPSSVPLYGSVDRWAFFSGSSMAASQSTDVPSGFQFSLRMQRPAGASTTNAIFALQVIESVNMRDLAGQPVTLSFWAKAGANFSASGSQLGVSIGTGTVADQGSAGGLGGWTGAASPINAFQTITTTWTRYSFTGTIGASALEMDAFFYFTPAGTAGADDSFYITGVQLEVGSTATAFERRQYGQELMLCQRYYEIGYSFNCYSAASISFVSQWVPWCVTKRATPDITFVDVVGNLNRVTGTQVSGAAGVNNTTLANSSAYVQGCRGTIGTSSNTIGGFEASVRASAEL